MSEYLDIARKSQDFQTPPPVCGYMVSLISDDILNVLEPTQGRGNIVKALKQQGFKVTAPDNFFTLQSQRFDAVVGNPPFSAKFAFGYPEGLEKHGMRLGYHILLKCMEMADTIIMLMPWFTILDSDVRLRFIKDFGLKSITALPRKTFQYARIQTCVFHLEKGFKEPTEFKVFDRL